MLFFFSRPWSIWKNTENTKTYTLAIHITSSIYIRFIQKKYFSVTWHALENIYLTHTHPNIHIYTWDKKNGQMST